MSETGKFGIAVEGTAILCFERIAHLIGWSTVGVRSKRGKFTTAVEATAILCFRCALASASPPLVGRFGNRYRLRPEASAKHRCCCFCTWRKLIELQQHYTGSEASRTMHLTFRHVALLHIVLTSRRLRMPWTLLLGKKHCLPSSPRLQVSLASS